MCNQMVTSEIKELLSCAFCPVTSISSHLDKMQVKLILKFKSIPFDYLLTPGRTGKFIPPPWYKGGVDGASPPLGIRYVAIFRNNFALNGKPWIFFLGIFYGWWRCWRSLTSPNMVAILATILDFIKI